MVWTRVDCWASFVVILLPLRLCLGLCPRRFVLTAWAVYEQGVLRKRISRFLRGPFTNRPKFHNSWRGPFTNVQNGFFWTAWAVYQLRQISRRFFEATAWAVYQLSPVLHLIVITGSHRRAPNEIHR